MRHNGTSNYHYNKALKNAASALRKQMTSAEARLWKRVLRSRAMKGHSFRRQRPVLRYIADFMCKELRLIIEVDGSSHDGADAYTADERRDYELAQAGYRILRIPHQEVLNDLENVRAAIAEVVEEIEDALPDSQDRK